MTPPLPAKAGIAPDQVRGDSTLPSGEAEEARDAGASTPLSVILAQNLARDEPTILVEIARASGSTPREAGAAMLVTLGESLGTIGGGNLEFHAVDVARAMLARGERERRLDMALGPLLGQCCGGHVRLGLRRAGPKELARLRRAERAEAARAPAVLVFGCGHTGRALAAALAPLPVRTAVIDDRLEPYRPPAGVRLAVLHDPVEAVALAPPGAAFVVMTHSHALDYRIAEAALRRGDAAYVGLIGSATKRARFAKTFLRDGGLQAQLDRLVCPIGGQEVADKRPAVIAALTAAELLRALARYESSKVAPTGSRQTA